MNPARLAVVIAIGLFVGMAVCLEAGYRLGNYASRKTETAHEGTGTIEAAIFALLGFTFANGMSHLDQRRQLIVQEANAIGSAYLRLDLLPAERQQEIRVLFRQYLDARLEAYEKLPDLSAAEQELDQATKLQQEIWSRAVAASREDPTQNLARLLLPGVERHDRCDHFPHNRFAHPLAAADFWSVDYGRAAERSDGGL